MAVDARNILLAQLKKTFGYETLDEKIVIPAEYKYKLCDFSVICKFQSFYVIEALEEENEPLRDFGYPCDTIGDIGIDDDTSKIEREEDIFENLDI